MAQPQFLREVDDIGLGDVVIGEDGGEGEEENGDGDQHRSNFAEDAFHADLRESWRVRIGMNNCASRIMQIGSDILRTGADKGLIGNNVVLFGHKDDQCGRGADQERGDIDGKRLNQPLLHGMFNIGSGGGMRTGTLTGFVGINTALHAPADGRAKARLWAECITDNQGDKLRYMGDIDSDDNQGKAKLRDRKSVV